jgi:hypothetical protein
VGLAITAGGDARGRLLPFGTTIRGARVNAPLLLVSGATQTLPKYPEVGRLIVPRARNRPETLALVPRRWAMDNGAFSKFRADLFLAMLQQFRTASGCLFVVAPDVVANAGSTIELWAQWAPVIRGAGFPVAFAAQDGLRPDAVPWECDALFIGGSTAFKLSREARSLAAYAKARGKWVHMGRVNSRRRLRYAMQIDIDSIDGSSLSWFAETHIPRRLRWIREIQQQGELAL